MKKIGKVSISLILFSFLLSACNIGSKSLIYENLSTPQDSGWWNSAVFYEIFVRSFYDSNGDGAGDLSGIQAKLDYLNDNDASTSTDLGVTAIWLMPVFTSGSYHGYDVIDYRSIDPDYGTLEDFRLLVDAVHAHGMRIILDLVINHTSSENPWFADSQNPDSPYRDWYIWSDTKPGGNYEGGRAVWHPAAGGYYYGYFGADMPDLNYVNEAVTSEILDIARFWAVDMDVDGFRIDAARYLIEDGTIISNTHETHAWFADFYSRLRVIKPDIYLVGEVWADSSEASSYIAGHELTQTFDFDLSTAMINSVNSRNASSLNTVLARDYPLYNYGNMGVFITNHDMPRSMSQFGGDAAKARLGAFLMLTSPGTPYIYYGEEIGMLGQKPDEMIRTPMQWSAGDSCGFSANQAWEPLNQDCAQVNTADQKTDPLSLWNSYASFIHLRQTMPALSAGDFFEVKSDNPAIYSALRVNQDQAVLVVANLGLKDLTNIGLVLDQGPLAGRYRMMTIYGETQDSQVIANSEGGFTLIDSIRELGALQTAIFLLEPR